MERITTKQLQQIQMQAEDKRRVRGTKRTTTADGITHDSKTEADRWEELKILERSGLISGLRRQVEIGLCGRDGPILTDSGKQQRVYRADFTYVDHALGATVIEDRKGHATEKFKLVKAILAAQGIEIVVTNSKGQVVG